MRVLVSAIAVLALSGCQTIDLGNLTGPGETLTINSDPQGALLTLYDYGECETPCTIKINEQRKARIAKAGFKTLELTLQPSRNAVTIPLELAAASEGVDEVALPELD